MNSLILEKLQGHMRSSINECRDQIPDISDEDIELAFQAIESELRRANRIPTARVSLRKLLWETLSKQDPTHSIRTLLDICFPAQIGPLGNRFWKDLENISLSGLDKSLLSASRSKTARAQHIAPAAETSPRVYKEHNTPSKIVQETRKYEAKESSKATTHKWNTESIKAKVSRPIFSNFAIDDHIFSHISAVVKEIKFWLAIPSSIIVPVSSPMNTDSFEIARLVASKLDLALLIEGFLTPQSVLEVSEKMAVYSTQKLNAAILQLPSDTYDAWTDENKETWFKLTRLGQKQTLVIFAITEKYVSLQGTGLIHTIEAPMVMEPSLRDREMLFNLSQSDFKSNSFPFYLH
jgi:hypothetical protein